MQMKRALPVFFILFIFIFTSVGLGFITTQVFNGSVIATTTDLSYTCPNIDTATKYDLVVPIPSSQTGETTVTPVYKKKPGNLNITKTLPVGTTFIGKLAIDLNENELNVVKGAFIFLWLILIVVTIGCTMFVLRR